MTAVWNKFTSQLSNWLAEGPPGKWRRRESDNPEGQRNSLRSSSSLSTLNQKHLVKAAAAIRSKSSENLNRVGGNSHRLLIGKSNVPAAERCQCCPPSEASSSTSGQWPRSASKSSAKANNGCCVPATQQKQQQQQESRFPSSLFLQQHQTNWRGGGGGVESGYSSASPSRKKSTGMVGSASSLFFQNLRGRNKQKQQQQPLPKEEGAANCWAEQQQLQSNASSSGASSAATNGASDQLTSGEAQKKRCWRFSGTSMLPFADEEEMVVAPELGQHEKAETADNEQQPQRNRRPSAPDGQQQQSGGGSLAHALLRQHEPSQKQLQHYLISPPKKAGPKKTKSTFAILFPHNSHLLPSSLSWSSHLATRGSPQKAAKMPPDPAPPPIAAAASAEDGLTVPATEDFGHFLRRPSAASQQQQQQQQAPPHSPSQETVRERRHHHKLPPAAHKRKSSSSTGHNRLMNALLNAGGRWRSNSRLKNATPIGSIVLQAGDGSWHQQKRSRSVGANQQLRISSTMLPLEAANGCAINNISNVGLGLEDVRTSGSSSLMFGNLTFEDAHPAYWAPLGFRTPQSDVYHSCRGGTLEQEQKSPTSSATSSNRQGNAVDIFRRLEKIGEGSYATVWKSENRIDGSIVALKEIRLQEQEGLPFTAIREISLLRALRHANIVHLHQIIIQQPKALVLVFEYMRTDLAKYLEQYAPHGLDQYRAKVLLFQLLRGLAYCHERKILHRDLKPQNLLLSTEGELKLADFGLARAKSVPSRTFSHDVVTLWYRPPDVLLGSTLYSISLDMWGVGCIFAEMCTGCALFPGANEVGDQLERIFSVRGLPNPELWPDCLRLPKWAQFSFPAYTELGWPQVEPALAQLSDQGQKLLSHFLQLNPRERISAEGAMLHKYFDELPRTLHALLPTESVFSVLNCSLKWTLDRPTAAMAVNSFFDTNV